MRSHLRPKSRLSEIKTIAKVTAHVVLLPQNVSQLFVFFTLARHLGFSKRNGNATRTETARTLKRGLRLKELARAKARIWQKMEISADILLLLPIDDRNAASKYTISSI